MAAKFQQIAGIYDSTPRDFAQEMRKDAQAKTRAAHSTTTRENTAEPVLTSNNMPRVSFDSHVRADDGTAMHLRGATGGTAGSPSWPAAAAAANRRGSIEQE